MNSKSILSLTMSGHGFSGAICIDGKVVVANSLERLTRKKYDMLLPMSRVDLKTLGWNQPAEVYERAMTLPFDLATDYSSVDFGKQEGFHLLLDHLLQGAGIELADVDCVTYSYRHNESARRHFARMLPGAEFIVPEHHLAHACQAFLPSPFSEAAIMVIDGQGVPLARTGGDPLSGCLAYGRGRSIETLWDLPVRHSLGGMYAEATTVCGFATNEEGKTMGLAPYGTEGLYDTLKKELRFNTQVYSKSDLGNIGGLVKRGFRPKHYLYELGAYHRYMAQVPPRSKGGEYSDAHKDVAYAAQKIVEDVMVYLADWLHDKTKSMNLVIAGGVGLNCVANYEVLARSKFRNIFVYPNAGDNGLAVGQALYVHNVLNGNERSYVAEHDYLGRSYSAQEVAEAVEKYRDHAGISIERCRDLDALYDKMALRIEGGSITSWWQGRSEFGPRALGNRSIIADPRRRDMKDVLNSRVKFRESFRPFTPSVLAERASDYFSLDIASPFMLFAPHVKPGMGDVVPAITHVDNTARVQTVERRVNERYYDLIKAFERRTGVAMVLNTSFNIAGEPIVETPEDAIRCFLSTDIDVLGIDDYFIQKLR